MYEFPRSRRHFHPCLQSAEAIPTGAADASLCAGSDGASVGGRFLQRFGGVGCRLSARPRTPSWLHARPRPFSGPLTSWGRSCRPRRPADTKPLTHGKRSTTDNAVVAVGSAALTLRPQGGVARTTLATGPGIWLGQSPIPELPPADASQSDSGRTSRIYWPARATSLRSHPAQPRQ